MSNVNTAGNGGVANDSDRLTDGWRFVTFFPGFLLRRLILQIARDLPKRFPEASFNPPDRVPSGRVICAAAPLVNFYCGRLTQ